MAAGYFGKFAGKLSGHGYSILPLPRGSKVTRVPKWTRFCTVPPDAGTIEEWRRRHPDFGIAIACGSVLCVDIDASTDREVDAITGVVFDILGPTPLRRIGASPRIALAYRATSPMRSTRVGQVDLLAMGRYVVAYNLHPMTGRPYRWTHASPLDLPLSEAPAASVDGFERLRLALGEQQGIDATSLKVRPAAARSTTTVRRDDQGRAIDGRDTLLRDLVFEAWRSGEEDAESIAIRAWARFRHDADLERPKRDGETCWAFSDALDKAHRLIKSGKIRSPHVPVNAFWTDARQAAFREAIIRERAAGHIPLSALAVSNAMLHFAHSTGICFAAIATIAAAAKQAIDTTKKARRLLVSEGLWIVEGQKGGRRRTASYFPNPAVLDRPDPTRR